MAEQILPLLDHVGVAVSLVGALVIAGGFPLTSGRYLTDFRRLGPTPSFDRFKVGLGRALLWGLEILVVSEVIETITVDPTPTALELDSRWPWQRRASLRVGARPSPGRCS